VEQKKLIEKGISRGREGGRGKSEREIIEIIPFHY
jgi:hypothetical protein